MSTGARFQYSAEGPRTADTAPAPLFPDLGDQHSKYCKMLVDAKKSNDTNFWPQLRQVVAHDLETLPFNRFKVWASVWMIPIISRFRIRHYVETVMAKVHSDPTHVYENAIKEPMTGLTERDFPMLAMFDDFPTTMNRIQHLAHLLICGFDKPQLDKFNTIVELGAGIGEMTDIIYKLGYQGTYQIYDFPELLELQRRHHQLLPIPQEKVAYIDDADTLMCPDLVIATWSLTEMPLELREQLLNGNLGHADNWLIAYSNKIFGYDNDNWIHTEFVPRFKNHDITFIDVPYMPWDGGTKYLVIKKRA